MSKYQSESHKICILPEYEITSKLYKGFLLLFTILTLLSVSLLSISIASASAPTKKIKGTGGIIRIGKTAQIALTTIDDQISVEDKANIIIELIQRAPRNKVIYIVIEPSKTNKDYFEKLVSLVDLAAEEAKKTKGVRVNFKMVNYKLTAEIKEYLQSKNQTAVASDNFVMKLQDNNVIFSEADAPKDLVTAINRETSLLRLFTSPIEAVLKPITSLKNLSVSGLAISTILTHQGLSTVGPSWVYVNDGVMSKEMIMSYALSLGLLYYLPRQENTSREIYELTYDFLRSPGQAFRALFLKGKSYFSGSNQNIYLTEANPRIQTGFNAFAGAVGFSIPLQALFYYFQEGNVEAIWEMREMIIKNGFLIGAASAPYSFLTEKLKNQTNLSANLITHLRTGHLATIGFLAATMPSYNGLDAKLFNINTMEEAMLLAMGAVGVFANYKAVDLVNKLDKTRWWRFFNANFQALTDATGNFFRRLVRLEPTESEFMSWSDITNLINDEIAGITREMGNDSEDSQDGPIFFRRASANMCEAYLR